MHPLFTFLLLCLAAHRITRMITRDRVPFGAIRETFIRRWGIYDSAPPGIEIDPKISISGKRTWPAMRLAAYGIECDWCMSVSVSGTLTLVTTHFASVPLPWLTWLAVSSVAALIAQRETD